MRVLTLFKNNDEKHRRLIPVVRTAHELGLYCLFSLVGLTGCIAGNTLTPLARFLAAATPAPQGINVNFCTDPAVQQKFAVKTLVIFDHSGSNQQNYLMSPDSSGAPLVTNGNLTISPNYATDPTGELRYGNITTPGTLLNFLANTPANDPANPSRYFASIDFSDAASTYPINSSGFTSDVADFYAHMKSDSIGNSNTGVGSPSDTGSTSYLSALTAAYGIINSDVQQAKTCALESPSATPTAQCLNPGVQVASSYIIVFMSDGSPILSIDLSNGITINREPTNNILGSVQTIMGLTANTKFVAGINLFTIYYYNPLNNIDGTGQSLLAQMAKFGNGLSYNAISGSKIDYTAFVPPTKLVKYSLADIFVTNSSVAWGADGTLLKDSDQDGIPDNLEIQIGSDPTKKDTNGNGVSDLVEYQLARGVACSARNASGICTDAPINYAAGGAACAAVSSTVSAGVRTFASSDPSGLNDCEKILLNDIGGIGNPDSNGDILPDWLQFKNGIPFQLGAVPASSVSASDLYNAYDKVKYSLPNTVPLSQILNLSPSQYQLSLLSTTASQDCYQLNVMDLPMIGSGNHIRVDVIEKSELLQDRYLYRRGDKVFPANATSLFFNDWNNSAEQTAGTWQVWQ